MVLGLVLVDPDEKGEVFGGSYHVIGEFEVAVFFLQGFSDIDNLQ
jgi:hypothetical protein